MLRNFVVLFGFICSLNLHAQQVLFVSDLSEYSKDNKPTDLAYFIVEHLQRKLSDKYQFDYQGVSREREWRLVSSQGNVCLYNKVPTVERLSAAYFTRFPIIAFAPNRLILRKSVAVPDGLSLAELTQRGVVIGVEDGRAYGFEFDKQIEKLSGFLYRGQGINNATRLRQMLKAEKLDGILEFTAVIAQNNSHFSNEYRVYDLAQSEQPVFGYIACSLSPLGKQLIAEFNQLLAQEEIQTYIVQQHLAILPEAERAMIKDSLTHKFNK